MLLFHIFLTIAVDTYIHCKRLIIQTLSYDISFLIAAAYVGTRKNTPKCKSAHYKSKHVMFLPPLMFFVC